MTASQGGIYAPQGYSPMPGIPDEMVSPDGSIRPLWQEVASSLFAAKPDDLELALARAGQYLRDSGVYYRQYGTAGSDERPWPLSPVPVLMDETDWHRLTPGLIQRAELLERLMADLYGPNEMVARGALPPAILTSSPEWLRPLVGVKPRSGHYLHFLAFEVGRGPDGNWWVLADRSQAPSGAGFALENRVATSRAFSSLFAGSNVQRLAGFFRDFRNHMLHFSGGEEESRAVILTPGPMNETYFEHSWIARYLGMPLVQGEDLTVEGGQLKLRTVSGPRPVDVLWRRLDSSYADPVELNAGSRLGTPGLVSALRAGGVTLINALGSGILETRALMAFMPRLSEALLGQPLLLPNIATWWLADKDQQDALIEEPAKKLISQAFSTGLPFESTGQEWLAAKMPRAELAQRLAQDGANLVAQEVVRLSTTPVLSEGKLVARPMTIRVFLARTPSGWQVMPGGFARIGASPDPAAIAMQNGGSTADVWVMGHRPPAEVSMLPETGSNWQRIAPGDLPSRAADNLFWLGRYIERTEASMRLLRALHVRVAEMGDAATPILTAAKPLQDFYAVSTEEGIPEGLLSVLSAAIGAAGQVRDRFSPDAWSALADIDKTARRMALKVTPGDDAARALSALLRKLAGITGLVHENMYRVMGWRFLSIGRKQERAMGMTTALAVLADPSRPQGALDLAIELGDAVLTHRRFSLVTNREAVLDLLALDEANPRSIRHQVEGLYHDMLSLPRAFEDGRPAILLEQLIRLKSDLHSAKTAPDTDGLWALRTRLAGLSEQLTEACFR